MPKNIALLRAINVAGHNMISMAELRELVESLGFSNVVTLLQSGNVLFDNANRRAALAVERQLETETAKRFKVTVDYFVRTAAEWTLIVERNPFADAAKRDPGRLLVSLLKKAPTAEQLKSLQAAIKGRETVHGDGRQLYILYPDGVGRSKLTTALLERKLGTSCTGRNWNTVLKIAQLAVA